jgi:hypothetical protein
MRRLGLACACASLLGACGDSGTAANQPPNPAFAVDQPLKAVGIPFVFSAVGSDDPDGSVLLYRYLFADGTPEIATSADVTEHAYPRTGLYLAQLTIIDDDGAEAGSDLYVTVVERECDPNRGDSCVEPFECIDFLCQCENGGPPCGGACCDAGVSCIDGACTLDECSAPLTFCPGWGCVDLEYDENSCGVCGRQCEVCEVGKCRGPCPEGWLFCPDGCTDTLFDPFNCGGCGRVCETGMCQLGACSDDAPGSVIEVLPPPPYQRITGMTYQFGTFYLMTGRRFSMFDPWSGVELGNWFLEDEAMRRANGLASDPSGSFLYTGASDRFDPASVTDLEAYLPFEPFWTTQLDGSGGPITLQEDAGLFWVFDNLTRELVALDAFTPFEVMRRPVAGLGATDRFTDLAYDGYGGVWAVRPDLEGPLGPRMVKIALDSFTVILDVSPPDADGLGGVVVAEGVLWAAGRDGVYRMVP